MLRSGARGGPGGALGCSRVRCDVIRLAAGAIGLPLCASQVWVRSPRRLPVFGPGVCVKVCVVLRLGVPPICPHTQHRQNDMALLAQSKVYRPVREGVTSVVPRCWRATTQRCWRAVVTTSSMRHRRSRSRQRCATSGVAQANATKGPRASPAQPTRSRRALLSASSLARELQAGAQGRWAPSCRRGARSR